ncbi:hypothetical protein F5879DRAFT_766704, partial [Lentinula edodes]
LGLGGWLHNVQGKYQVLMRCTFSFSLLPPLSLSYLIYNRQLTFPQSIRNSLEEQPAGKGLQALFKGGELAVESVLREVCDRVLEEEELIVGRKVSSTATLQILGEAYVRV